MAALPSRRLASGPVIGAAAMVGVGLAYAIGNVITQWITTAGGVAPPVVAFWQYGLALLVFLPRLVKSGFGAFRTERFGQHLLRVGLATAGVQFFVAGLAHAPVWQVIAVDMTSPFIVVLGAGLLLGEPIGRRRWLTTAIGFLGGMIILAPWSDRFSVWSLMPLGAAAMWAGSSVMTKAMTAHEPPETVTAWLLLLLTPIDAVFLAASRPEAPWLAFVPPPGALFAALAGLALLTAAAQHLLTVAYAKADAAFLQPFDHLRLPMNVVAGFLAFGYAPGGDLWLGSALIVGASLWLLGAETPKAAATA
jgi:drug/metabolite transporter (DMT)-like permease